MRHLAIVVASIFFAVIAAVGVSTVNPPVAEAASGGYVKKCGGGKIFLKAKEKSTFARHNKIRKDRGLRVFCVHPALQRAARVHSKDMIKRNYFHHTTKAGTTTHPKLKGGMSFAWRIKAFGYLKGYGSSFFSYGVGENIYGGNGTKNNPAAAMRAWRNSPGHWKNIINPKFREIGIGTYTGVYNGNRGWTMYTADFGYRK